ncbi:MAG TPA: VOC family protein [Anaerolineales bacterium]|nr:VOC family protein [Anaerolineales bacterium]
MTETTPFLMFCGPHKGQAEEAITLYVSLLKSSQIIAIDRYGANEHEPEGTVRLARFTLAGREYMAIDSAMEHNFTFTPAFSIFVTCEDETELETLYETLGARGAVLMPLGNYGFSRKFGWVNDRYGVSWQMNLP